MLREDGASGDAGNSVTEGNVEQGSEV